MFIVYSCKWVLLKQDKINLSVHHSNHFKIVQRQQKMILQKQLTQQQLF